MYGVKNSALRSSRAPGKGDRRVGWHRCISVLALVSVLFVSTWLTGCSLLGSARADGDNSPKVDPAPPADVKATLTLYFADSQAQFLVPEKREVAQGNASLPDLVVQELIKGPATPGLGMTIPREARLVSSVKVENGTAFVNFNKEFQSKHWGGSAGETMTVYSIVNSLTELEGIKAVVFLVEGEKLESLAGHMDLTQPIQRDESLIAH
ncbi:MAG TPA: GerMN domain-containing protein [Firmicutes bacterium]|nr:GerMN domain-containing protein [Bacillota bacterium]